MESETSPEIAAYTGDIGNAGCSRRPWATLRLKRLATSSAEFASSNQTDAEGLS
jgi:hypothetical protein